METKAKKMIQSFVILRTESGLNRLLGQIIEFLWQRKENCERFEPRIHFKRLSLIVRVNVVLNRTVVVDSDWRFDNLCGSHLQSQSELYHVSWWYYTLVIDLIGQIRRDVIGLVKPFRTRICLTLCEPLSIMLESIFQCFRLSRNELVIFP